jgi:type I restriction enzyme S subunit
MAYWRTIKLREVINFRKQFITINDTENYKLCRVQTKVKGVVLREVKLGIDIKTKSQQVCRANDLIFAEMDARFGGYGIIPEELEGAVVSSHYFLYEINEEKIDKRFLEYCLRMPWFLNQVVAKGSTNYAAIRPHNVLEYEIPYPLLSEQQHIISKIEAVQIRIEKIKQIRREQDQEIRNLCNQLYLRITEGVELMPMQKICPIVRREVIIQENETYPELGIRSFGKGTFHKPALAGIEVGTKKLFRIEKGDLMFSNVFAWEGAIAVAKDEDDARYGSHRFISCVADRKIVLPEFICFHFLTQKGLEDVNGASPGGAGRNKTLGLNKLMNIHIPVPKPNVQQLFINEVNKLNIIREYHLETLEELNALLPSLLDKAFNGELTGFSNSEILESLSKNAGSDDKYESISNHEKDIFYIRASVDAYILDYLKGDPHLHRTKMEKATHLIEYHCKVDLQRNPVRDAAGPSDYSSRIKVESVASKKGFYTTQTTLQQNGFKEISYTLLDSVSAKIKIAEEYFGERIDEVNILLNLIRPLNTKQSEVVATLYGSWNDFLINGKQPTDNEIIQDVRNNWDIKKKRIPQPLWDWGLNWMRINYIIPKGKGKPVLHKPKQP